MQYVLVIVMSFAAVLNTQLWLIKRMKSAYAKNELHIKNEENIIKTHLLITKMIVLMLVSLFISASINTLMIFLLTNGSTIEGRLIDVLVSIGMLAVIGLTVLLFLLGRRLREVTYDYTKTYSLGLYIMYSSL
ncbi:hypothetical protein [Liberiplasma polymorphum]|uniref:hypothetical protein n=1 Tax=Liberiplasma polymorphum TaxID=3374570 RepID=UPI003775712E